jgi:hypothetical protein
MILLVQGQTNSKVTLTCNEKKTINNPYYIFKFTNEQTNDVKIFYTPNLSVNKDRYDLFSITETETENLLTGNVSLIEGDWIYEINESETISLSENDWTGTVVEKGKVKVLKTEVDKAAYENNNTNTATYGVLE